MPICFGPALLRIFHQVNSLARNAERKNETAKSQTGKKTSSETSKKENTATH